MVRLSWCWIMVESIVIPHGLLKWFYLSFYIHPCFLGLLQILLWIRKLHTCLLFLLIFVFKISTFVITSSLRFFNCCFSKKQSTIIIPNQLQLLTRTTYGFKRRSVVNISATKIYQEEVYYHVVLSSCSSNSPASGMNDQFLTSPCSEEEEEEEEEEEIYHVALSSCSSNSPDMGYADGMNDQFCSSSAAVEYDDDEILDMPAPICNSNSLPAATNDQYNLGEDQQKSDHHDNQEEEVIDPFYNAYLQKMKWFDVLNHERFFAIKAMMNQKHLSENIAATRLAKTLDKDFELVYVAQSCLSWEALHHQFTKVEALAISSNPPLLFHNSVAARFQKFQILLERFLEDERCEGTRHSNYVHRKYSLQTLLLVPHLSGYPMEDGKMLNEEGMKAIEVLKTIEECITTFWLYVKVDTKRLGWNRPCLEDPRDLDLLLALTKLLRKKEVALKGVEGKRRCWLRRRAVRGVHNQEEESSSENTELMCTRIDMKLVGRVLKLPIISTSHLKWCQHKLGNIEFNRDGKLIRAHTSFLFPS